MIFELLFASCLIAGIILIIFKKVYIGVSLIAVSSLILGYMIYRYYSNNKNIALQILSLKPKDKPLFDKLCDKLFKKEGKETYDQYQDMKLKRNEYESQNLCKNLAKVRSRKK